MNQIPSHSETEISDSIIMSLKPVVSVMITTYNQEEYITEAIEGVIRQQTDFPIEVLIGEDCSTDKTREIVLDYQRQFPGLIRLVYTDRNLGAWNNSNRLFTKVRGEFVAYCEGDDYWTDPLKLQKQVNYFRSHPDCVLVHTDYDYLVHVFGSWRIIKAKSRPNRKVVKEGYIYPDLLKEMSIRTCTMMGRTENLKQHYNSSLRTTDHPVGDRPLVLHLSKMGNINYIDESMAVYRRAPGSIINSGFPRLLKMRKMLLELYNNFSETFHDDGVDWESVHRSYYKGCLYLAYLSGDREAFENLLAKIGLEFPDLLNKKIAVLHFVIKHPMIWRSTLAFKDFRNELYLLFKSNRVG